MQGDRQWESAIRNIPHLDQQQATWQTTRGHQRQHGCQSCKSPNITWVVDGSWLAGWRKELLGWEVGDVGGWGSEWEREPSQPSFLSSLLDGEAYTRLRLIFWWQHPPLLQLETAVDIQVWAWRWCPSVPSLQHPRSYTSICLPQTYPQPPFRTPCLLLSETTVLAVSGGTWNSFTSSHGNQRSSLMRHL